MCGICGWFAFAPNHRFDQQMVTRMNNTLTHRGPDDAGVITFEQAALAMRRLSIIDLATGHQPIANDQGTCWIVFNGEIYNYLDLRHQLEAHGYHFNTRSDTEVVLHAYEEWGQDCVSHLRGMFAIAIYDQRALHPKGKGNGNGNGHTTAGSARLFLARDRVGKKPLYYYHDDDHLLFASEIKAILAHPHVPRRVNHYAIPLYLTHGYVPAPLTMFAGIYELPPGHTLTIQDGTIRIDPYWDVTTLNTDTEPLSEQAYCQQIRERFEEAVRIRLMSEVPLGAFLSGGLDSTAIVACMTRLMDQPVKTFAIGFTGDPSFNELEYARLAARTYGTEHHEFLVQPNAVDLLRGLVWHYDQPFADSSAIPTYLVSKLTREHVTVALTGDGGDELFAGYERFAAARLAETYRHTPQFVRSGLLRLLSLFPESTSYYSPTRRIRRFLEHAPLPLAQRYLGWVGIFQNGFLHELLRHDTDVDPVGHFTTYFSQVQDADPLSQLLAVNAKTYLPGDLLVKTDRMSMANSLEARSPFLDHELVEFAARIPAHLKLKGFTTKYILKEAMKSLVPHEILHRKKHGFGVPVGRWFRTSLKDYVREMLLSPQALRREYFREEAVRRLLDEHQEGKRDHSHRLWALLTFEVWHQVFLDRGA